MILGAEAFGREIILADLGQQHHGGENQQIDKGGESLDVEQVLGGEIALGPGADKSPQCGQSQAEAGERDSPKPPERRGNSPVALAEKKAELAVPHQSRKSSLMPVLERVWASTVLTMTAQ